MTGRKRKQQDFQDKESKKEGLISSCKKSKGMAHDASEELKISKSSKYRNLTITSDEKRDTIIRRCIGIQNYVFEKLKTIFKKRWENFIRNQEKTIERLCDIKLPL